MACVTGVVIAESACTAAAEFSKRGCPKEWMAFRIVDENVVEEAESSDDHPAGTPQERWEKFVAALPNNEPRYVIYSFEYLSEVDNVMRAKTLFIRWCPSCSVRLRICSAMYEKPVHLRIANGTLPVQICGAGEAAYEAIQAKILSKVSVK